jgi:hypothetical protein
VTKLGRWVAKLGKWEGKLGRWMAKLVRWVANLGRWVTKLGRASLLRQLSGFESRHLSNIQNWRHKQVANTL